MNKINSYDVYFPPSQYWLNNSNTNIDEFIKKLNNLKIIDSLYIHFPFCPIKCHLCPYIKLDNKYIEECSKLIIKEIDNYSKIINNKVKLKSILFGGGTPNFAKLDYFKKLVKIICEKFDCIDIKQVAIEIRLGIEYKQYIDVLLEYFKASKVHISIGLQSSQEDMIKYYRKAEGNTNGLFYTLEDAIDLIYYCKNKGINQFNIDYMIKDITNFNNEKKNIKYLVNKHKVNKITLYPLFTKFMERENKIGRITWNEKEIINLRKSIYKFLKSFKFKAAIWPNYFVKNSLVNYESLVQFKGSNLLAIGPSARGNLIIDNSIYMYENSKDFSDYKKNITTQEISANKIYNYPKELNNQLSIELRGIFINWRKGIKKSVFDFILSSLNKPDKLKFEQIIKNNFIKKDDKYFFKDKSFYLMEVVFWDMWDILKKLFK